MYATQRTTPLSLSKQTFDDFIGIHTLQLLIVEAVGCYNNNNSNSNSNNNTHKINNAAKKITKSGHTRARCDFFANQLSFHFSNIAHATTPPYHRYPYQYQAQPHMYMECMYVVLICQSSGCGCGCGYENSCARYEFAQL